MKKLLRKHQESVLVVLAAVFLALIVAYFVWGVDDVITEVNQATNAKGSSNGSVEFDIQGAASLNLRGLVNQ